VDIAMKDVLWEPYGEYLTKSNITRFIKDYKIKDYEELVKKSTPCSEAFNRYDCKSNLFFSLQVV
jgi:hypothetical protein